MTLLAQILGNRDHWINVPCQGSGIVTSSREQA